MSSQTYRNETYKGVEIRTRCVSSPRDLLWSGNYSFFTGTIASLGNDRICRDLVEKFATEEDAVTASFAAGRQAVDQEIRITTMTTLRTRTIPQTRA